MTIRGFRRLPRSERREVIDQIPDSYTRRIMKFAFLGPGKRSWVKVAMWVGGGSTPDGVRMMATRALSKIPEKPVRFCPKNHDTMRQVKPGRRKSCTSTAATSGAERRSW